MVLSSRNLGCVQVKCYKIETIAKKFKIFWSLQVRTCVYAYRTLRACNKHICVDGKSAYNRRVADKGINFDR